jgi:hypothetical protein
VGIILWSSWRNLIGSNPEGGTAVTEAVMKHYADMGIKGFKVDFFDRDDQQVIASAYQVAACAAKHHLYLDYHGLKPCGIQRAYPNIFNFEGAKGLENSKWEPRVGDGPLHNQPRYDVTAPYLRMLAGPMDYTPGAMTNAMKDSFFGNNNHPMSQGTRVHQMAMYTIFEAPLQMLADSPTKYMQNQECTDFIAQVPTTFDETVVLAGELGEYIAIARRKGSTWYVAGGESSVGRLIADANGRYAWANDKHSGSLSMTFETVLDKAGQSDVWIFNHFGSGRLTYSRLASEYPGYKEMKAFKEHNTWYVDTQQVTYFEEVPFRPDFLLRDYICLLHPELGLGQPKYYTPVATE